MKTTYITDMEVCNTHGHEMIVDAFFMDDGKDRRVILFAPGTTTPIEEVPFQSSAGLDIYQFEDNEIDGWWEHAATRMNQDASFLDSVSNLVRADERREDTSHAARAVREHLTDRLGRPDPIENIHMPDESDVVDLGELIEHYPVGEDNEGEERVYLYKGQKYLIGWVPGRPSYFQLVEDEE